MSDKNRGDAGTSAVTQVTYTPTGSWVSGCTYEGRYFLVGDMCHLYVQILCSGGVTATTLTVNLPAGINIDTSKLFTPTTAAPFVLGQAGIMDTGTAYYGGVVVYESASAVRLFALLASGTYASGTQVSATVPHTFANTDRVMFQATFPWVAA